MAVNYGLLEPVDIAGQFMAGRQQAQQNQLAQQQAEMRKQEFGMRQQEFATQAEDRKLKLADYKTKQAGLDKFLELSVANGKTGSPKEMASSFYEYAITQRDPQLIMSAQTMMQAADEREKYQTYLKSQQTIPAQQAPTPMAGGLGSGTFGIDNQPGMPNALASRAAAPMNALATQTADPVAALESKIAELGNINDPRAQAEATRLRKQVDQYNQPFAVGGNLVTGGGRTLFTAPEKAAAPPAMVAEYTFAKTPDGGNFRGSYQDFVTARAAAGRAPAQPRPEQPPVAVVDPATGKQIYVTREQALSGRMTPAAAMESLPAKEIQKREAALPQATSSIKGFESKADKFVADLKALRDDPGLENITGPIFGRTGSVTREGSRAQAQYDKIVAKGGFQALQDLRDASKTGGALGNVSNQEGKQLTASFAAIDRRQNAEDVKTAIDQAISDIEGTKTRMREAYDSTYSYKSGNTSAPAAGAGKWKVVK